MKILNYTIIIKLKLLSIITIIMLLQSCSKENNNSQSYSPKNYYFYLTAAQLNQTPYFTNKAFDTISFASDKGDTLTFVKTKTDTSWYCERTTSNPDNNDQNCYQTLHNTYGTIKGNGSFDVKHILQDGSDLNLIKININNNLFEPYDDQIGRKSYYNYKQSITIENKIYSSLIVLYSASNDTASNEGFINKEYGLFYFKNKPVDTKFKLLKN